MRAPSGYVFYMTVTVLFFASYADSLGAHSMRRRSAARRDRRGRASARVRALPGADHLPSEPLMAVNERYARGSRVLEAGDEVAIIPPVAGG